MQKFSYHTHTDSFGVYDGHNSATEMIAAAEAAGYTELGISNHLICKRASVDFHHNSLMTLNKPKRCI